MTRDIAEVLDGGNPSKNQVFSCVSETTQSIWDMHTPFIKYSSSFFFFTARVPGKLNPNKAVTPIAKFIVVHVKLISHLKQ